MQSIRNIPSYDDQVRQLHAFVSAREDTVFDTINVNKRICTYLNNHSLGKDIEDFLGRLVEADDVQDFKHDECYEGRFTTWAEHNARQQVELEEAAYRQDVRREYNRGRL